MIVKKWLPYPTWDFAGIERWLNDQAQSGYLLNGWPGWSFIGRVPFRTDPDAKRTRYRLDPGVDLFGEEELRRRIASYRDAGWRYEGKVGKFYAIYSCDDPQAPDLYNDTSSMALVMKKQTGRAWFTLFLLLLWLGTAFWDEWVMLLTRPFCLVAGLILDFDFRLPLYGAMLLGAALIASSRIGCFRGVHRIQTCLRRGDWPDPARRTYPEAWRWIAALALLAGTVLYLFYLVWFSNPNSRRLSGPEEWKFPHVTLEEVIPAGAELHLYTDQEILHHDELSWSSLAPEQYDVAQAGAVRAAGGPERDARVNQEHVRALSPALAELVYRGRVEEHRRSLKQYQENWEESTPFLHDNADAFAFLQEEEITSVLDALTCFTYRFSDENAAHSVYIGLADDRVFVLDCSGAADGELALHLLLERLGAA